MPKLRILSDLHLEAGPWKWQSVGEDILVLAGDIADSSPTGWGRRRMLWDDIALSGIPTVYVLGNHEGYANRIPRDELVQGIAKELPPNVTLLDRGSVVLQGIRFLGCSLWTDFSLQFGNIGGGAPKSSELVGQLIGQYVESYVNDFNFLCLPQRVEGLPRKISAMDMAVWHRADKAWLSSEINNSIEPTVVVTHFLPSPESISERYAGQILNTYFATDCRSLMKDPVRLWIHGHTHTSCDYMHQSVRVICNPRGYTEKGKGENQEFHSGLTILLK